MSAFDDLLDLSGPTTTTSTQNTNQSSDPFDPIGQTVSSGDGTNGGDTLLDFGFDASVRNTLLF